MDVRERLIAYRLAAWLTEMALGGRRRSGRAEREAEPTGPIRIVMSEAFGDGGTSRAVYSLAGYLAPTHELEIINLIRDRDDPFFAIPPGTKVVNLDDRRPTARRRPLQRILSRIPSALMHPDDRAYRHFNLWTDIQLLRRVRSMRGGVLLLTRPCFNAFAARFAPGHLRVIAQEHTNLSAMRGDLTDEIRRQYGKLDVVAVLTASDERNYRELLKKTPVRLVRIPNAVPRLAGEPEDEREKVVLAAGRLIRQKGFDLLIRAFAEVAERHPEWQLRIYGEGLRRDEFQQLIDELRLGDSVALPGPTSRVGELMSKASIFALSSRSEGFPLALLEAMSKGMAVVSFDCPTGPSEAITHGHDGLLVPPEDVEGLSAALLELVEDEDRRRRLGAAALETAERYTVSAIGERWEEILRAA